jgi:hypothetical protein
MFSFLNPSFVIIQILRFLVCLLFVGQFLLDHVSQHTLGLVLLTPLLFRLFVQILMSVWKQKNKIKRLQNLIKQMQLNDLLKDVHALQISKLVLQSLYNRTGGLH